MAKLKEAMKWFQKHSEELGKKYKDQWLAIGATGVKIHSPSYSKVAKAADDGSHLLVKVPRNPQSAYFY